MAAQDFRPFQSGVAGPVGMLWLGTEEAEGPSDLSAHPPRAPAHALVALMPQDPGGEQHLCLWPTLPILPVTQRLSRGLGLVSDRNPNGHKSLSDFQADPGAMGNYAG